MTATDFTGFYHAHFADTVTLVYSFTADMPAALVIEVPAAATPPAEQVMKRGTQRRRTRTAQIAAVTVLVLAGGLLAAGWLRGTSDHPPVGPSPSITTSVPAGCRQGQLPVSLRLPQEESQVNVDVFNATDTPGLAAAVATDLRNRKFDVGRVETGQIQPYEGVAVIRFGPQTIGAAHLLNAYVLGEATMEFDVARTTDTVDLFVGGRFRQLATSSEMRQAIALMGRPELPQGTCALPE